MIRAPAITRTAARKPSTQNPKPTTGSELVEALENGVCMYPKLEGRFPCVAGLSLAFSLSWISLCHRALSLPIAPALFSSYCTRSLALSLALSRARTLSPSFCAYVVSACLWEETGIRFAFDPDLAAGSRLVPGFSLPPLPPFPPPLSSSLPSLLSLSLSLPLLSISPPLSFLLLLLPVSLSISLPLPPSLPPAHISSTLTCHCHSLAHHTRIPYTHTSVQLPGP